MEEDIDNSVDASTPLRIAEHKDSTDEISFELKQNEQRNGVDHLKLKNCHKNIESLRELMPLKADINFEGCDDGFLLKFLRARKFSVDNAFELLCNYFEFKKNNIALLEGLKATELRYILEDGFPCVLPYLDCSGSTFMVLFPGSWDTETFAVEIILKALVLSLEHLSQNESVQLHGVILLVDFSGWTTTHATCLNITYIRKIVAIFQDCFPVWFRQVHIINQPWYVNALITVMRPFLKDKVQDRVFLHGNNMMTLHTFLPPEILPAEFGGDKSEVNQSYWAKILLEAERNDITRKESVRRIGKNPLRWSASVGLIEVSKEQSEIEPLLAQE